MTGTREARGTAPGAPSFDAWATARLPALLRFAYLVTGSQHAAEDAVQTALVRACERWARVRRTEDPDVYVRRMVVNAHVSAWRKAGRREVAVAEVRDLAPAPGGLDDAERLAREDQVWRLCTDLPPQQRAAVVLRYYEDLEYPEIAAVLDVAEATARSHVHRAVQAMRAALAEQAAEEHADERPEGDR